MKRLRTGLAVAARTLVLGSLAAGCGAASSVGGAVKSAVASASITLPTTPALPTTALPTTAVPTTLVPTTPVPTTVSTTVTVAPTTAAQATPTAAAASSGSSLLWLWIVLAAVVLIGLITWIARASGRRSAAAANWRTAVTDAYSKGQALADSVRIADTSVAPDADARQAGLQARADDLAQELYRLRERAPGEEDRMRVEDTLTSLRGLRSALADEHAAGGAGGPGSPEATQVRGRLMAFEESLRALRASNEQTPRI
jgi:hypothetical protein